jgi:hypothetical protein
MPNTRKKTKASLLAAAAATAVKDKLLSKEQAGPTYEERSKMLYKEQSVSLSKEVQKEPEGEEDEKNLQFGQDVVEHDEDEVEEEEEEIMPNTWKKTKSSLLAAAAATSVKDKLLPKEQTGPTCEERSKLLSKEQSVSLSNEVQQEPEGKEDEENLQFGQDVVEHDDEEVEEEDMETQLDNGDSYQPSDESGEEGKSISFYLPCPPP